MKKKSNDDGYTSKTHHGDANKPSSSEYRVKHNPNYKPGSGDWAGSLEPVPTKVNAAKILREINGKAKS